MLHDDWGGDKLLSQVDQSWDCDFGGVVKVSLAHPFSDVLSSGEKKRLFDIAIAILTLNTLLIGSNREILVIQLLLSAHSRGTGSSDASREQGVCRSREARPDRKQKPINICIYDSGQR